MKSNRCRTYIGIAVYSLVVALASLALGMWWQMPGFYAASALGGLGQFLAGVGMRRE